MNYQWKCLQKFIVMKNLVCPVSIDRIPSGLPRVIAFFVISLLGLYIYTQYLPILVFLVIDFFTRGFVKGKYSLLLNLSKAILSKLKNKGRLIDLAPKTFAARLGSIFTALILIFHLLDLGLWSVGFSFGLIALASLECIANICVGCILYTYIVFPLVKQYDF